MQQQIKLLKAVEDTLEKVEVHGRENWDRMLGCVDALRRVRADLTKMEKELKENATQYETECGATEENPDSVCGS